MSIIRDQWEMSPANILSQAVHLAKAESLTRRQLECLQRRRFLELLTHVVQRSDFYRDYYREHGVNLQKLDQVALHDLPMIDKKIVMEHFDQLVCDKSLNRDDLVRYVSDPASLGKKYNGKYRVIHTSGSSGTIGIYIYGPNDWATVMATDLTRVMKLHAHPRLKTRLAFVGAVDGHYAGATLTRAAPKQLFEYRPVNIGRPSAEVIAELNDYQPHVLTGYSSGSYLLALEQLQGHLKIRPERIVCSADPLTTSMAEVIYQAFGVRPFNFYAASESPGMGVQCERHQGLHMFSDTHIFEVIKDNGEPAGPGETGTLVLTTLCNFTEPLIRYRMGDRLTVGDEECSCGWPFPVFKTLAGRDEQFLVVEDLAGSRQFLHPGPFAEFVVPGMEKLQVVQVEQNKLRLNVVIRGDREAVTAGIRNRMDGILATKKLLSCVGYTVDVMEDIPNDPKTGKFTLIVPYKQKAPVAAPLAGRLLSPA